MANRMPLNQPPLDDLMDKVDSRYTLVVLAAKRARAITEEIVKAGGDKKISAKPVTLALKEIAAGKIRFKRLKQGIK